MAIFASVFTISGNFCKKSQQNPHLIVKPKLVFCHGHITSGCVKGTNVVLVNIQKEDPYNLLHNLNLYVAEQYHKQQEEVKRWASEGKVLSPYATNLFMQQKTLATSNQAYRINTIGSQHFRVVDTLSRARISHNVCIDKENPSCTPCDFWSQHLMPCRHMMLVIGTHQPTLLSESRNDFSQYYFHPSFLVKNLLAAYNGAVFCIPDHPVGPPLPEIITIDCDSIQSQPPMRMLPSIGFGIDDYKGKTQRGRPRTKRIRSRGAVGNDGECLRKRSKRNKMGMDNNSEADGNTREAGHDALMSFALSLN